MPKFDEVIDDDDESDTFGQVVTDQSNEKYTFAEAGLRLFDDNGRFGANLNFYYTLRADRSFASYDIQDEFEAIFRIKGVDQRHMGVELESSFQATNDLRFDLMASFGNWKYLNDVNASYVSQQGNQNVTLAIKDLKVGDAPQTQLSYAVTWSPISNLSARLRGFTYAQHYSDFTPLDRIGGDNVQPWKIPGTTFYNLHLTYDVSSLFDGTQLFFNMLNVTDEFYISDAEDNSPYNAFDNDHDADDAEVYLGLPRRYNFGFRVNF